MKTYPSHKKNQGALLVQGGSFPGREGAMLQRRIFARARRWLACQVPDTRRLRRSWGRGAGQWEGGGLMHDAVPPRTIRRSLAVESWTGGGISGDVSPFDRGYEYIKGSCSLHCQLPEGTSPSERPVLPIEKVTRSNQLNMKAFAYLALAL